MRHTLTFLATFSIFSALTGCQTPEPAPAPKEPAIVRYESDADPVHVRNVSIHTHRQNRGGAALRAEDVQEDILWQKHYEGTTNPERLAKASGTQTQKTPAVSADQSIYRTNTKFGKDLSVYSTGKHGVAK